MANYLTIDIGNSSVKAAIWQDSRLYHPPIWGDLKPTDLQRLCAGLQSGVDCVALCSVANDRTGIREFCQQLSPNFVEVNANIPLPLSLGDYDTSTLGPDRIAALVGAFSLFPHQELLVIDCGTAITFDHLDKEGVFLGGNIAPGLGMRQKALNAFTARLPRVETDPNASLWGSNTVKAIQAGALYGVIAEIEFYHRQCPDAKTILTGGRTRALLPLLDFSVIYQPDLVLIGLRRLAQDELQRIKITENQL